MMSKLDWSRDYAEVCGLGTRHYTQDGRDFYLDGSPKPPEEGEAAEVADRTRLAELGSVTFFKLTGPQRQEYRALKARLDGGVPIAPRKPGRPRKVVPAPQPAPVPTASNSPDNEDLRTLVEIAGGTWTEGADAAELLADED